MSAREALDAARNARLALAVKRILVARGMSTRDFILAVYGKGEPGGKVKGSAAYRLLGGKGGVQRGTLKRWAPVLGVTVEQLEDMAEAPLPTPPPPPRSVRAEPARSAADPDQFSLVVDARGRATLRLNLVDVPMERAMRAMGALTSAGLLSTSEGTPE